MLRNLNRFIAFGLVALGATAAQVPDVLRRQEAERLAVANNPQVHVRELLAKVQGQAVRETQAGELPNLTANFSGVEASEGSRLTAGALPASRLLTYVGGGLQFSQLIMDFGRTRNLVATEKLKEKARLADAAASREDIVLAVDQLFFQVLEAQATLQIADQTVTTRQTLVDQVTALTDAKLRSSLDLSFAQVNLSRAKLLRLDALNGLEALRAALTSVMGFDKAGEYTVKDDTGGLPSLPADVNILISEALGKRPDLQSLQFSEEAARKFARAQEAQLLPNISATGVVGGTPVNSSQYFNSDWYGAVGVNIGIPVFDGFRLRAQVAAAKLQAQANSERSRELHNNVVQGVRTAWLSAETAQQRVAVSADLLKQATLSADLAQTRYGLGLSSIVELSEAQLQQTEAQIGDANARAQYRMSIAALRYQIGGVIY